MHSGGPIDPASEKVGKTGARTIQDFCDGGRNSSRCASPVIRIFCQVTKSSRNRVTGARKWLPTNRRKRVFEWHGTWRIIAGKTLERCDYAGGNGRFRFRFRFRFCARFHSQRSIVLRSFTPSFRLLIFAFNLSEARSRSRFPSAYIRVRTTYVFMYLCMYIDKEAGKSRMCYNSVSNRIARKKLLVAFPFGASVNPFVLALPFFRYSCTPKERRTSMKKHASFALLPSFIHFPTYSSVVFVRWLELRPFRWASLRFCLLSGEWNYTMLPFPRR